MLRLAREARKRSSYRVPDWARTYVGLEADAAEIRTYEAELVPGLLQTEAYTRAVIRAASPTLNPAEVDRIVAVRAQRQSRLQDDRPPLLWVVLNEAVIRRPVGGREVMGAQLQRLRELGPGLLAHAGRSRRRTASDTEGWPPPPADGYAAPVGNKHEKPCPACNGAR